MKFYTRLLLLFFLFSASAYTAKGLTAGFTADVTSGCAPLVVHFTNTSTGATGFYWDLGNGTTTTLTDASTSYTSPGTYTVILTASGGGATATYKMTITVYPPPAVNFFASDTAVCPGVPIAFTSTTISGVPGTVTLTWDFGDGTVLVSPGPTHPYLAPGYYNVTLSATNSKGCVATMLRAKYIHIFTPPVISMAATTTYFCQAPGVDLFNNYTTGTSVITYAWSFGDGGTSTLTDPPHTYITPGSYTVSLTAKDGNGCIDSSKWISYIYVGDLTATFTAPSTACVNSDVFFTNTSSKHVSSNWSFGDGGTDTANNGTHVYTTAGTYTVTLIVFDGSCYDTVTHPITVIPGPVASFTQSPLQPCPPPVAITFTATVPAGATVKWLFGDKGTGTGSTVTHTYANRGIDTIRMIVTDPSTGCTDTTIRIDTFYDLQLAAKALPTKGCVPLDVVLSCAATTHEPDTLRTYAYPYGVASYTWDFGDGSAPATGSSVSHTYLSVGIYYAVVTAITNNGCMVTDTVRILAGSPPVITASVIPTHICYNKSSTYTVTVVVGPVTNIEWDFGDGTSETTDSGVLVVTHTFALPGVFSATLTPSYNGCPGPPFVLPAVTVDSPKAIIVTNYNCSPRTEVDFFDKSMGDDSHLWIFGDGTTSALDNPVHDYPSPTVYIVSLATYNALSGCRDTASAVIDLTRPVPDFTPDHSAVCKDSIIHFTPTVTGGGPVFYAWYVGDRYLYDTGHFNDSSKVLTDTFYTPGIDTITLVITDHLGCFDTVFKTITVAAPVVNFSVSPSSGCWPLTAIFTDYSTDQPGITFTNYSWIFGDGGTASVAIPSTAHTYYTAGTFFIKEIVTDNVGCMDSVALPLVTVYRPTASFFASNVFPCVGDNVFFSNTSTGISRSLWLFGDGTTDTTNSPWHAYTSPGVFTVKLVVTDPHGCTDTAVYTNYITISKPVASFYMSDSFSICPPLTVTFYNTSTGATGYNWTFGDGGSISYATYPSNLYVKPGLDTVMLIATDAAGCSDTAYGHVTLFGYAGAFTYTPIKGCAPLTVNFKAALSNVPNIVWDYSDGSTSSTAYSDTISHVYVLPGEYLPKLILSDNTGCENSSLGIDTIKVDALRAGFTTEPNPVCVNTSFYFRDTTFSYFSYVDQWLWTFSDGDTSTLQTPPAYTYPATGSYPVTLSLSDAWGCKGTATENLTVYPPPVITVSPDTIVCLGDAATLTGYGGVSYIWSPTTTVSCTLCNPTLASPEVITNYTVTSTDEHGCVNTDTVGVFLKTLTVSVSHGDTAGCFGIVAPLLDSGATKFTWLPPNGLNDPTIADPLAAPDRTTQYTIIAQLGSCLPDTNYVTVTVYPVPTVSAGPDQTLVEGSKAQLLATGTDIYSYDWGGASTLSCNDCQNPVASMLVTTTYVVTVADSFGCPASDSVTIHLFCDNNQLFLPNCFTPNGDGKDDVFYPRGRGVSIVKSFRIYNRWGELLFERDNINVNDASNAWDGSYNGGTPRPDVYVYVVEALCENGQPISLKGDVTIIR